MPDPLFQAKDIWKNYPSQNGQLLHVLQNINLTIYPDEVVAIIGFSGCGKSTLLRILAGLIPQTKGHLFYHGKESSGLLPGMSMVFQSFALYPWMTVKQNIEIVLKAIHVSVKEMEKRCADAIALIGLNGFEDAYPRELSGGMKQRVGIARALVCKPELLFMDEPFSEVDAFTAEVLRSEVIKIWMQKDLGLRSILFVSHDVHEVAFMADRIVVLGNHPAEVLDVIKNELPRPRDYRAPEFLQLVEKLHDTYGRIEALTPKPKPKPTGPLLPVGIDEILGLLVYLHARGGSCEIFKIGAERHVHFEKTSLVLDAAKLLAFVEVKHRTALLTESGKEFAEGARETRHHLWKKQLLTIPIFAKTCELLKNAPGSSVDREEMLAFLNREFPHHDPNEQFTTLIRWSRYGNLLSYHKMTKILSLPPHPQY
jgi:NitT/TauT family transport system ATP-binding protein